MLTHKIVPYLLRCENLSLLSLSRYFSSEFGVRVNAKSAFTSLVEISDQSNFSRSRLLQRQVQEKEDIEHKQNIKKAYSHRKNKEKMLKISVDGNISSGKSTLVSKLVDFFRKANAESGHSKFFLEVVPEPLEKWCNLKGHNLLDLFYKQPEKYNFLFQHYVQLTRLEGTVKECGSQDSESRESCTTNVRVMERSLQNNRHCFLELAKSSGKMHPAEFTVLAEWYTWLETNLDLSLDVIIYLRTKPETAYSRMKVRARSEEDFCPMEYLTALHESYENWLIRKSVEGNEYAAKDAKIIVLDAEKSKEEVEIQCFQLLEEYLGISKPVAPHPNYSG